VSRVKWLTVAQKAQEQGSGGTEVKGPLFPCVLTFARLKTQRVVEIVFHRRSISPAPLHPRSPASTVANL
jgi:hypothetical protein